MENVPTWVYVILALGAGLFGNQFLGRVLASFQEHRHGIEQAEISQRADMLQAIVEMVQNQSNALLELLKESLRSNQVMANNMGQLAMAIEGSNRDAHNQFLLLKESLAAINHTLTNLSGKVDDANDYTTAVVKAIGGNLDDLMEEIRSDQAKEAGLESGAKE